MTKKRSRLLGGILLLAGVLFVLYALQNPQASFPWSNAVTYSLYGLYAAVILVLLAAPFKRRK